MEYIKSTKEVLALKALNRDINSTWVNWAVEMIQTGMETEHLLILANADISDNQFILQELATKVLDELHLEYSDKERIIKDYTCYLIERNFNEEIQATEVLNILQRMYVEMDFESYLEDFYFLYFAKSDLIESKDQWYINGVDRSNIDQIIKEKFTNWIIDYKTLT